MKTTYVTANQMVGAVNTLVHPVSMLHPTILLSSSLALPSVSPSRLHLQHRMGALGGPSDNSSLRWGIDVTEARRGQLEHATRACGVGTHLDSTHTPALNACKTSGPPRETSGHGKTLMTGRYFL